MQAGRCSIGNKVKVDFTNALCTVTNIDYSYGRVSISLSYFNGTTHEVTTVSGHNEVTFIKEK